MNKKIIGSSSRGYPENWQYYPFGRVAEGMFAAFPNTAWISVLLMHYDKLSNLFALDGKAAKAATLPFINNASVLTNKKNGIYIEKYIKAVYASLVTTFLIHESEKQKNLVHFIRDLVVDGVNSESIESLLEDAYRSVVLLEGDSSKNIFADDIWQDVKIQNNFVYFRGAKVQMPKLSFLNNNIFDGVQGWRELYNELENILLTSDYLKSNTEGVTTHKLRKDFILIFRNTPKEALKEWLWQEIVKQQDTDDTAIIDENVPTINECHYDLRAIKLLICKCILKHPYEFDDTDKKEHIIKIITQVAEKGYRSLSSYKDDMDSICDEKAEGFMYEMELQRNRGWWFSLFIKQMAKRYNDIEREFPDLSKRLSVNRRIDRHIKLSPFDRSKFQGYIKGPLSGGGSDFYGIKAFIDQFRFHVIGINPSSGAFLTMPNRPVTIHIEHPFRAQITFSSSSDEIGKPGGVFMEICITNRNAALTASDPLKTK